jgi:hypothetical protein
VRVGDIPSFLVYPLFFEPDRRSIEALFGFFLSIFLFP